MNHLRRTMPAVTLDGVEPFAIIDNEWNDIVDFIAEFLPMGLSPSSSTDTFPHPWSMRGRWNTDIRGFAAKIKPGFVRAHGVEVNTLGVLLSDQTKEEFQKGRNGEPPRTIRNDDKVTVALDDEPWINLPKRWKNRAGPDRVDNANDDAAPIPSIFIERYGVYVNTVITVDRSLPTGIKIDNKVVENSESDKRLLSQVFVVLQMPRPRVEVAEVEGLLGTIPTFDLSVRYVSATQEPPKIQVVRALPKELLLEEYEAQSVEEALANPDNPYDYKLIATIWAISPANYTGHDENVTSEWQTVVQYHTWWNLDYTVNADIDNLPPQRVINPAAGLVGGVVTQQMTDIVNAQNEQTDALYRSVKVNGAFWSV